MGLSRNSTGSNLLKNNKRALNSNYNYVVGLARKS